MQELWIELSNFFTSTISELDIMDYLDIAIVALVIYQVFKLTRRTRANQVLKGFVGVLVAQFVADQLGLQAITWLLTYVVGAGAIVMVILFQPELRSALEHLGRGASIDNIFRQGDHADGAAIAGEITSALINLSRRKVGALIVIEQKTGLAEVAGTGTKIDSAITGALIENIFEPNTPLHDGAVLISKARIWAAGCYLHMTEEGGLSKELGTRHRAAIGVTEGSDCVALIVSEETGIISYTRSGRLTRYLDQERLRALLMSIFSPKQKERLPVLPRFLRKGGGDD